MLKDIDYLDLRNLVLIILPHVVTLLCWYFIT